MKTIILQEGDLLLLMKHAVSFGIPEGLTEEEAMDTLPYIKSGNHCPNCNAAYERDWESQQSQNSFQNRIDDSNKQLEGTGS